MISSKIKKIFNSFLISILIVCILSGINIIYQLGMKSFIMSLFSTIAVIIFYSFVLKAFNFKEEHKKLKDNLKEDLYNKKFYYIKKRCFITFVLYLLLVLVFFLTPKFSFILSIIGLYSFFRWTIDCLHHYKHIFLEIKNEKKYAFLF